MEAWNTIPPHEPSDYFYAFLARITRHISLNRCRDRDRLKRSAFISELSAEMEQCIPAPDNAACRILKTDNHGSISLVNRETGEQIECDGSAAFFDDAGTGSYEDCIFTGIEADALDTYALYGTFVTSAGPVEGNWSVTFPLENTEGS